MTIKEKAKELAEMYFFEARTNSYCRQATQQACEMMAHWVVNKAVERLKANAYSSPDGSRVTFYQRLNDFLSDFKKAMEGGEE